MFRRLILLFGALTLASFAQAAPNQRPESAELAKKLYWFVAGTQFRDQQVGRRYGSWRITARLGTSDFAEEANSFLTARTMVTLAEVNAHTPLQGFNQVARLANQNLGWYYSDAEMMGDPSGTIAYFPVVDRTARRRGIEHPVSTLVAAFNVPDDFDSSSQAALWFLRSGAYPEFVSAFAATVGRFRDLDRAQEHPHDQTWKPANSGAFMTWAEPDQSIDANSRIFNGVNDVDCVVNLNVLTTLATYGRMHGLPAATAAGVRSSCEVINEAVRNGAIPSCALWYNRAPQFWLSYSAATAAGASCLQPSRAWVESDIVREARIAITRAPTGLHTTDVAQTLIALKRLYPPASRSAEVAQLANSLEAFLRGPIKVQGGYAYPASEDSLYIARGFGVQLDWYSPSYSAALALLALTLD